MTTPPGPFLTVRIEGPAVRASRMRLEDFLRLGSDLTRAVHRVGLVLAGHDDSRASGRPPEYLKESLQLDIVGFTHGSEAAKALFERTSRQHLIEAADPGGEAFDCFVQGLEAGLDGDALPRGYDTGVLMAVRNLGTLFDRGVENILFSLDSREKPLRASYDEAKRRRVQARIHRPDQNIRTVEGRLMMADFNETGRRIRVEPPVGPRIPCTFDEALEETVHESLRRFVQVTGVAETDPTSGQLKSMHLTDLVQLSERPSGMSDAASLGGSFWERPTIDGLAEAQEVAPPTSLEELEGGWPEDELEDGFEQEVTRWRHDELERGS